MGGLVSRSRSETRYPVIAIARPTGSFEFTYAELGLGTTSVTGEMEMLFEDTWAHFCIHHFNQDGLVRERSRLTAWLGS